MIAQCLFWIICKAERFASYTEISQLVEHIDGFVLAAKGKWVLSGFLPPILVGYETRN